VGLGALMEGAAFARRRSVRRAPAGGATRTEPHPWAGRVRLAISIAFLLGWWIFWYTDQIAVHREGIEHFVPVSSQPPTFFWLTAVVTVWCVLGVARWAEARR
jgi:hypothetical protein